MDSGAKSYLSALTAPFSKDAIGAQVPDMYSFPTSTQYVRCEFTLSSDAGGNVDFSLLPHIYASILTAVPVPGTSPNATANIGGVANTDFGPDTPVPSDTNFSLNGVLAPQSVGQVFDQYRIVGWGARIRPLVAPLNQAGRLLFSSTPSAKEAFPYGLAASFIAQTNTDAPTNVNYTTVLDYLNLPSTDGTQYLTTEILNLPEAMECSYSDLSLKGGLEWVSKQVNTTPLDWNDALNNNEICPAPHSDNLILTGGTAADVSSQLLVNREFCIAVTAIIGSPTIQLSVPAIQSSQTATFAAGVAPPVGAILDINTCIALGVPQNTYIVSVDAQYLNSTAGFQIQDSSLFSTVLTTGTTINPAIYVTGPAIYSSAASTTYFDVVEPAIGSVLTNASCIVLGVPVGTYVAGLYRQYSTGLTPGVSDTSYVPYWEVILNTPVTISGVAAGTGIVFYNTIVANSTLSGIPNPLRTAALMQWQINLSSKATIALDAPWNCYFSWIVPGPIANSVQSNGNNINNGYDHSYLDSDGWSVLSCRGVGLTPSTQALSVEVCYHLEGIQPISPTTGAFIASAKRPYVNRAFMDAALEVAAQAPYFMKLQDRPTQALAMLSLMNA